MVVLAIKIISLFRVAQPFPPKIVFQFLSLQKFRQINISFESFTTLLGIIVDTLACQKTRISGWGLSLCNYKTY